MKKQIVLFSILLPSIFLFSTCKRIEETWVKTKVDGIVTDLLTGQPIEGATVAIRIDDCGGCGNSKIIITTYSSSDGKFNTQFYAKYKIDNLLVDYYIGAGKAGYAGYGVKDGDEISKGKKNSFEIAMWN